MNLVKKSSRKYFGFHATDVVLIAIPAAEQKLLLVRNTRLLRSPILDQKTQISPKMRGDFWTAQRGNHIFGAIPGNSDAKRKKQGICTAEKNIKFGHFKKKIGTY